MMEGASGYGLFCCDRVYTVHHHQEENEFLNFQGILQDNIRLDVHQLRQVGDAAGQKHYTTHFSPFSPTKE